MQPTSLRSWASERDFRTSVVLQTVDVGRSRSAAGDVIASYPYDHPYPSRLLLYFPENRAKPVPDIPPSPSSGGSTPWFSRTSRLRFARTAESTIFRMKQLPPCTVRRKIPSAAERRWKSASSLPPMPLCSTPEMVSSPRPDGSWRPVRSFRFLKQKRDGNTVPFAASWGKESAYFSAVSVFSCASIPLGLTYSPSATSVFSPFSPAS